MNYKKVSFLNVYSHVFIAFFSFFYERSPVIEKNAQHIQLHVFNILLIEIHTSYRISHLLTWDFLNVFHIKIDIHAFLNPN